MVTVCHDSSLARLFNTPFADEIKRSQDRNYGVILQSAQRKTKNKPGMINRAHKPDQESANYFFSLTIFHLTLDCLPYKRKLSSCLDNNLCNTYLYNIATFLRARSDWSKTHVSSEYKT